MVDSLIVTQRVGGGEPVPTSNTAMQLFEPHLPCDEAQLRRVYLQLALRYHPDKWPAEGRKEATLLFQAIAAVYEKLMKPQGRIVRRVKSPIAAAAELGDVVELERLLRDLPSRANEEDDAGATPLMFAAKGGSLAAANLLVRYGAELHTQTPLGWSALMWAALSDQEPMVRWLVSHGMKVTEHDLILVSFAGNAQSLRALLELFEGKAAAIRTDTSGQTLLHLTVFGMCNLPRECPERYLDCVDLLLSHNVPLDVVDLRRGRTCLQIYVGHIHWLQQRFEASAAHMELVERLCAHGANPLLKDREGKTALSLADSSGLHRVRDVLLRFVTRQPTLQCKL